MEDLTTRDSEYNVLTITQDDFLRAAKNMERVGGHFAANLGKAAIYADLDNRRRLFIGFHSLFLRYAHPIWDPITVDVA